MSGQRRTVGEVLALLLDGLEPLRPVPCPVDRAGGLVLGADAVAPTALPPEHRAAMDGVAVRAADVAAATADDPVRLVVDGASLAGRGDRRALVPGTAREIATGAPLPDGADAIVRVEDLRRDGDAVFVAAPVAAGHDVRPAGEDAVEGAVLAAAGRVLDAAALGGLAGAGVAKVEVQPRPRVAVVPTGDEVVAGTTPDAVGPSLHHLLGVDGAEVVVADAVRDDEDAIVAAVTAASADHDLVVTVGGVSVGPRDHAAAVVGRLASGAAVSLAMRPGRPFAHGRTDRGVPVVCLPGSPVAALAAAVLLVRPVVARLAGRTAPTTVRLPLAGPATGDPRRRCLVPATVADGKAHLVPGNGAADLARLAATSALVDLPAGTERLVAGTEVDVWCLP